ncbi:MAG: hypothetical protein HY320_04335 [Armatimonadetes bacterium]|nr:hypothetical protein [Armatimonadota bacterium]
MTSRNDPTTRPPRAIPTVAGLLALAVAAVLLGAYLIVRLAAMVGGQGNGPAGTLNSDLEELRQTDPKLIKYREVGRINTGFQQARGIAVDAEGRLYVAGDQAVAVFGADGVQQSAIPLTTPPRCLAVGADGTLYAGMADHVETFDRGGAPRAVWSSPGPKARFTAVAVGENDVWVGDAGDRVVLRYDFSGNVVGRIGRKDAARHVPGLIIPSLHLDVALAPDDLLRVSNPGRHRIEAYTPGGDLKFSWGREGSDIDRFCGCCNPTDFALFPDGRFVTSEKGLPRVKIYSARGTFEGVVAGPETFGQKAVGLDVAVDPQERVLVLDPVARAVRVFVHQ